VNPPPAAVPVCRAVGDAAVLAEPMSLAEARSRAAAIRRAGWPGVLDVVPGLASVLVTLDPAVTDVDAVSHALARLDPTPGEVPVGTTVVVPTVFDGPDLEEAAERSGLGPEQVVAELAGALLEVAVLGFSPGFAYLVGLPPTLEGLPRRSRPRPVVPAGSVAVAGGYAAVYPQATPGGWQLLGRTALPLFDPARPPFARLQPGDRVRLHPVTGAGGDRVVAERAERRAWSGRGPAFPGFTVERAGLLDLPEDGGRLGVAHLGVPRAGAADPVAHRLANRLVGNNPGAATIEVLGQGPALRSHRSGLVALVGAGATLRLDGREVSEGRVVPVADGQLLAVGHSGDGARASLAIRGGWEVPVVLGSRSTDMLSWTGPGALRGGDELGVGEVDGPPADHLVPGALAPIGRERRLRILAGPQVGRFGPGSLAALGVARFAVTGTSDRVGIRLVADDGHPPTVAAGPPMASAGMVAGAVQVPPSGELIVLGPDHATLGGYPVLAVVITADLGVLGRCRPGDEVRFELVDLTEAHAARAGLERSLSAAVAGRFPLATG
jgi:KipI family sensor histidine kinase inhibitor